MAAIVQTTMRISRLFHLTKNKLRFEYSWFTMALMVDMGYELEYS